MVTGGEFKAPTLSLTGERAAASLEGIYVDRLFLATGGISPSLELTYPGFIDLPVKRAMIAAARTVYIVADSTKFGRTALASLGSVSCARYVITDDGVPAETISRINDLGVEVLLAR
jgi:DeoR/GlpR family transcriptional regulator of sugar metabolism